MTTEAGASATFAVVLDAMPSASVVIDLASSDPGEGTASPETLTFTPENWNAPQTVTVTGVDDDLADGPQAYTITTSAATSGDSDYDGLDADDVEVTNVDDETAGVTVTPTTGLVTTEAGATATFTIVLNAAPAAAVSIALSSGDDTEGSVSPASADFTVDNWDAPQTITVTGVDDAERDGDIEYTVVTSSATSTDAAYMGVDVADVTVTNEDDETAGVTVTPTSGLTTTEAGGTATFTVMLRSRPSADVTVPVTTSDATEGTIDPASLTFTPDNWNAPQTVTATGVDDAVADGAQVYMAALGATTSSDTDYDALDPDDVEITNTDDDSPGVSIDVGDGVRTSETGTTDTFSVVLNSRPTADVTIPVSSGDATEGSVSPAALTFTTDNWNAPQTVTVMGVDDAVADGDQVYSIVLGAATSVDAGYAGVDPMDVSATNVDNDSAGITVAVDDGVSTTEAATTDTFTVVLNSRPTADVTIAVTSGDATEGAVSPASLVFTVDNWNAPQTITVTGVDDSTADGDQVYTIVLAPAVSADAGYSGRDAMDVSAINIDDDSEGVTVTPLMGLSVNESGTTATFTVVLNSRPTGNVLFALSSTDTTEGTVSPATLTFTRDNWDAPQTVTVTGVDDATADGNQLFTIVVGAATSPDAGYDGINPPDVSVTCVDNDSAGVTVAPLSGLTTTEAGGAATFTVVLNSRPTADVTFPVSSSDTSEGTVSPATLTFTRDNWNAPQTITVTGVNDALDDGNQVYRALIGAATSSDSNYVGMDPADPEITNTDDDSPGFTVTPTSGLRTTEGGGMATFTVVLNSQPTADVTIMIASSDPDEGTASPSSLTFTPANWNAIRTVTVTGVPDAVFDGNQPYTIILMPATSADAGYDGLDPADVSVINDDRDPGVRVTPTSGLVTTEAGGAATFTVVLNVAPTAPVQITLASSDAGEGTVSPPLLTFTTANWSAPQTVTVTGVDDPIADGDQVFTIITSTTSSSQPAYNALPVDDVSVTNTDNETAGFEVNAPLPRTTTEAGGTAIVRIRLRAQPTADVTVPLRLSDATEAMLNTASITFTSANWNAFQVVTLTGLDDALADGDQTYQFITDPAMSADAAYSGLNAANVDFVNIDDETAGFEVTPLALTTREDGTAMPTFRVRLTSQPTADVTMGISSNDATEGATDRSSVTFTDTNWNAFQTVTVTGVDDAVADGDQPYRIVLAPATSADAGYSGLDPVDVDVVNVDDDRPGVTVTANGGTTTDEAGGTATFEVVLDSQPTANVTITLISNDPGEGLPSPTSLVFTTMNWNAPQEVTVTGVDDAVADGDQVYVIVLQPATSSDAGYNGINPADVTLTNRDDESPGVVVTPTAGLEVTETGSTATFTVVLTSQPTASVTIPLSSSDSTEGTVSPTSLTFTAANWNAPQTVTVTGVNDAVADGDQTFFAVTGATMSADPNYASRAVDDVEVTNRDDETAGVIVTAPLPRLTTTEGGTIGTFTIRLQSEPTAPVQIDLSSSDTTEGTVSPAFVIFSPANWNAPQTITVSPVDDFLADGTQLYTIVTSAATSSDPAYSGLAVPDVAAENRDNDTPAIIVSPRSGLLVNEAGTATDRFTIRLATQPTASVSIPVMTSDATEGTPSVTMVTFTTANWNVPVQVIVTGANDFVADGNQIFTISVGPASSSDASYMGLSGGSVTVVCLDDETPGITVTPSRDLVTSESGASDAFTVVLTSQPTGMVHIVFTWDTSEGSLSSMMLSFDDMNWNMPRTVTVTGVDDALVDGSQAYLIDGDPSGSTDPAYAMLPSFSVRVVNIDND